MTHWGGLEKDDTQRHWSGWHGREPSKTINLNYFYSAAVFVLSLIILLV